MNNIKISILTVFILSSFIFSKEKDEIKTMNKDGIIYQINSSSKNMKSLTTLPSKTKNDRKLKASGYKLYTSFGHFSPLGENIRTGFNPGYSIGVVLETPFTSMIDAAKTFYPYVPVSLLLKDKFDNKSKIKNINVPILIMHGEADQIVPFFMGKKMYEKANEPKYSYFTKHDNHMMEYDENLVKALNSFLKSLN